MTLPSHGGNRGFDPRRERLSIFVFIVYYVAVWFKFLLNLLVQYDLVFELEVWVQDQYLPGQLLLRLYQDHQHLLVNQHQEQHLLINKISFI